MAFGIDFGSTHVVCCGLVVVLAWQVFKEFDTDGSGFIDYDEFQNMVTALGFNISSAKALKYFRHIDEDGSGEIDLDEFRVAHDFTDDREALINVARTSLRTKLRPELAEQWPREKQNSMR